MSTFQLTTCLSRSFLLVLRAWEEDGFLGMDDVFFRTFVHNSCNEICFSVMSECFDYFGVVGCSFRTTVAGGWCRLLGSFIALSYVHHVDCAYINSSEKVDDPCS